MSFEVTRAVTILTPSECDKMVVSEADNGILFYSNDGSIVQRWSFDNISHVCLYSKRENKAQVKFVCGQKRELKFKTFYELQHFFQVMKALADIRLVDGNKIVQPPLRGQKVKEVVHKFEILGKKEPKLVLPPKATEQQAPPKQPQSGPSSSPKVKDQVVKFTEPLVVRMAASPPPPAPKRSMVPKSILKVWRSITPKPKLAVTLTVAPKPILKKLEAPKVEAPMPETSKPEPPKSDPPKQEPPKADPPKPETPKSAPLKPKRRAPPVPKIEAPAPAPAPSQPKPNVQIEVVEKKKSDLERLVDQLKQNDVKAMETAGFKVVGKKEQKTKPKIVGVTFKD